MAKRAKRDENKTEEKKNENKNKLVYVPLSLETKQPQLRCMINLDGHSMIYRRHVTSLAIAPTILGIRTKLCAVVYSYFALS